MGSREPSKLSQGVRRGAPAVTAFLTIFHSRKYVYSDNRFSSFLLLVLCRLGVGASSVDRRDGRGMAELAPASATAAAAVSWS